MIMERIEIYKKLRDMSDILQSILADNIDKGITMEPTEETAIDGLVSVLSMVENVFSKDDDKLF